MIQSRYIWRQKGSYMVHNNIYGNANENSDQLIPKIS